MNLPTILIACTAAALLLTACNGNNLPDNVLSESDAPFVPILQSTDLSLSTDRIVLSLIDRDRAPEFSPDTTFRLRLFTPTEGGVRFLTDLPLQPLSIAPDNDARPSETLYIARDIPFNQPGDWQIAVTAAFPDGRSQSSPRLQITVAPDARAPDTGDTIPNIATPTTADAPLSDLTDHPNPRPDLYQHSAADRPNRTPAILLFATWGRCAGRPTCQQALRQLNSLTDDTGITAIHVEPFGRQRPPDLQALINAMNDAWSIQAEPQFYFIDADNRIRARIQIAATDHELQTAARDLLRPNP